MRDNKFFEESTDQSSVKAQIVAKYFWAWAKIMIKQVEKRGGKIAYIDLFSGPGRYKDGSKSTPLLVLEKAIADPNISTKLVTVFNDKDFNNIESLKRQIDSLPDIGNLAHKPVFLHKEVGSDIVRELKTWQNIPTLFFIDPFGYKGTSLELIGSAIQGWGCDCILFFNYNRINMVLSNTEQQEHMNSLFGQERAEALREQLRDMSPSERESTVINAICDSLKQIGGVSPAHFGFKNASGNRTSHYIIFVSKSKRGNSIMKQIMGKYSSTIEQGVPSFKHDPNPPSPFKQLSLFDELPPLDLLQNMLLDEFAGETLTMVEIYERHHLGRQYIPKNYKDALRNLEKEGKIVAEPPASKRRKIKGKVSFGDSVKVTFPAKQ